VERIAIIARLQEGTQTVAAELLAGGPPFDLAETALARHTVYLSASEVVFVFEGHQVEWMVDDLISNPWFHPELEQAFDRWRAIIDGPPRIARARFDWERDQAATEAIAEAGDRRDLVTVRPGALTH
jgi:hypothetical protein